MEQQCQTDRPPARPVTVRVPQWLYRLLIGLAAWFALAAWLFSASGPTDYLLSIVSGFIFVVVLLQLILSRVRGRDTTAGTADASPRFTERGEWDLDTRQGHIRFNEAAVQILLPLAAAALGMTAIGIALHIAEHISA
jgi:hypothetical protein